MDDKQTAHAMGIDDTYRVERTLARGQGGVTELVSIDGIDGLQTECWSGAGCNYAMVSPADQPTMYRLRF